MEEKKKAPELPHQLTLTNRNALGIEGVLNMGSFEDERIVLETTKGVLEIKGENLHVQQLNLDQGRVVLDGTVYSLVYLGEDFGKKGKGFLGRLIK